FFEAFSRDESTYARLTLRANAFDAVERSMPGSTNVDFSRGLRTGIERLRSDSPTSLIVEDSGIEVRSGGRVDREERITFPTAGYTASLPSSPRCGSRAWKSHSILPTSETSSHISGVGRRP